MLHISYLSDVVYVCTNPKSSVVFDYQINQLLEISAIESGQLIDTF